jgi:ubiquinone/menaquinone biosynthesis C-methylase UbiE
MSQQYLFDNAKPQTAQRFASLATLYDPTTVRHLEAVGAGAGWQCLEVGGGGGSIAAWLARRVGATGHVLVTDIDPRYLAPLEAQGLPNLAIQVHDVERDPLPTSAFDLIHERLVLSMLPTAELTLRKLVAALKPGGWLLVEDYDNRFINRTFPTADRAAAAVFQKASDVVVQLLALHGSVRDWARGYYQRLRDEGLLDVGMEGQLAVWPGGSAGARLLQANFAQVRAEALERGLITEQELAEATALLDDPGFAVSSTMMFSAWGRRSPH